MAASSRYCWQNGAVRCLALTKPGIYMLSAFICCMNNHKTPSIDEKAFGLGRGRGGEGFQNLDFFSPWNLNCIFGLLPLPLYPGGKGAGHCWEFHLGIHTWKCKHFMWHLNSTSIYGAFSK